ncbi:MAG TPA: hypothetical protein VHT73_12245 [Thermodesulfobacteriota bacterium]|nr:hypothetical protein [Thermodesulfobacteriota bacterium]
MCIRYIHTTPGELFTSALIPNSRNFIYIYETWDTRRLTELEDNLGLVKEKVFFEPEKQVTTIRV